VSGSRFDQSDSRFDPRTEKLAVSPGLRSMSQERFVSLIGLRLVHQAVAELQVYQPPAAKVSWRLRSGTRLQLEISTKWLHVDKKLSDCGRFSRMSSRDRSRDRRKSSAT